MYNYCREMSLNEEKMKWKEFAKWWRWADGGLMDVDEAPPDVTNRPVLIKELRNFDTALRAFLSRNSVCIVQLFREGSVETSWFYQAANPYCQLCAGNSTATIGEKLIKIEI